MSCPITGNSSGSCPVSGATSLDSAALQTPKVQDIVNQLLAMQAEHECNVDELHRQYQSEIDRLKSESRALSTHNGEALSKHNGELNGDLMRDESMVSVFSSEKKHFLEIVQGAVKGPGSDEYKKLYAFLLRCFTVADNNHDGKVGFHEFEMLLETASSLPRKFGYAPTTPEMYATEWDRLRERMSLFNKLASSREGSAIESKHITFGSWLNYAIEHITKKAQLLTRFEADNKMTTSSEAFLVFILSATSSRASREYKEFYHFVLECFVDADTNCDGHVDSDHFDMMIEAAAVAPRRFGFAPKATDMYKDDEERRTARKQLFASIDWEDKGYIDFDQWLEYIYGHVCQQTQKLGKSGEIPRAMAACPTTGIPLTHNTLWNTK